MSIYSLLFAVLLCSTVLATPIKQPLQKKSFTVHRVRNLNYSPNGPAALRKAYVKYGFEDLALVDSSDDLSPLGSSNESANLAAAKPTLAPPAAKKDVSGTVPANPLQDDSEFVAPVSVGGQTIVLDFDTGSADLWLFNTQLPDSSKVGHTIFDPTKSATFTTLSNSLFNITYGDGSFASGTVGLDTVNIGGATVAKQAIGLPNAVAPSFIQNTASNGLVGLSFSKLNTVKPAKQHTFFENVQADLAAPVFTANLKHGVAGAYTFGLVDNTQFRGQLTSVPVDSSAGFWKFASTQMAIGTGAPTNVRGCGVAIADTGTSLLIVDPPVVKAFYAQIPGSFLSTTSGGMVFPCNAAVPDLSLAVGPNYMATMPGNLMAFTAVGTFSGQQYCFGSVQSNNGGSIQIFGDVFFKSQFVVFNATGPSLQVAPHAVNTKRIV